MNAHETEQVNAHDVYGFLMLKDSSTCIKAFTIFVNVPEILMQQFWYTITKIKGSESYEFLLADKRITSTKYTNSFVDYIASTLGTLAAVLLSTIENVDYPSLIWEDIAYQIDIEGGKSQDVKICHILDSQRLSLITSSPSTNLSRSSSFEHFHINQGDSCCGVDSNLSEWVRMFSTYGLAIHATMLNKEIIQSESYKRFILYSTGQIPLKKSRGKGSQGKKSADPTEESVDVSDESEPEPLIRRKTSSRREEKLISLTEAEEEAATRQVHATHARIVSESIPEPARRRQSDITISKTTQKLKGIQTLIPAEQEAADAMKALKDNRRMLGRKLGTGGSDEGTGEIPGVLDESIFADAEDDNEETDLDTNAFLLVQELTVRKNAWTLKMKDAEEILEQPPVLQQPTPIPTTITTPPINTEALAITTAIPEITPFIALQLRVVKLEQDMSEVKKFDHSADVLASIQSQVPPVVDKYLGTKLDDALLKTLERHTADLVEKYSRIIFHALMEALIEDENAMDKEVADTVKDHKRKHDGDDDDDDDDEGPPAGSNQGHCLQTRRKTNNIICSVSDTTTWFRPIPEEEERPASPEPGMGIPQLTLHEADKKLAHSIRWYCRRIEKKSSSKSPSLKVQHSEVKAIVAHRWTPGQVTIQPNSLYKQKIGVSYMRQERNKKLYQISKLKAALYPDFRLEELVLVIWIKSEQVSPRSDAVISNMQNQCYQYKTYERYGYNYLREIVLRRADYNEYKISENDFKILHPNDFEDLNILHIQGTKFDLLPKQGQDKLTFYKNKLSPQWRFLVHTILHCLSTKSCSWDQFGSSIFVALICLSDMRKFNWSSYIFKGMVSNIGNAKMFLMYPRFLQTILAIETSNTRPYKVFKLSSKLFANMKLNFEGQPMPLLAAMLSEACEGAGVDAPAVPQVIPDPIPEPMPETDQPPDHLTAPPRQQPSDPIAPVFEHGQRLNLDIASFSQVQETNDAPSTSTNVEDEPLRGSFHASPPRSTLVSPAGHTSGGAEDPFTLTALSAVVSTLVKKSKLWRETQDKERKVVVSDSDKEDGGEQDVDLDALHALANAVVTVDSTKSPGGPSSNLAASSYYPTSDVPTTDVPTDVPSGVAPTGPSTISPGSTTVPTSSSISTTEQIHARSGTTTATPSSHVRDARKGKVRKLSPEQLQEEFDKIQRAVAFTRGLKRDGSLMTSASSKKLKTGDVEVDVEAPSHGVPHEVEVKAPSQDVSREKVDAPSHSQNISEAQAEVPS
ncbi:hypothetical protein Tco_1104248 [Tanacetum coccineum]